jgi:hypothetical protein
MSLKLKGTRYVGLLRGIGPRKKRDDKRKKVILEQNGLVQHWCATFNFRNFSIKDNYTVFEKRMRNFEAKDFSKGGVVG